MTQDEERQYIAQKIAERMAAMLFIIGGRDMEALGYVGFDKTRPYLTRKGCDVFKAAMDLVPDASRARQGREP